MSGIANLSQLQHLCSAKLPANDGLACRIDSVDLKHVLGQIEAYNDDLLRHGRLL